MAHRRRGNRGGRVTAAALDPDFLDAAAGACDLARLAELWQAMPADMRTMMELRYLDGLSLEAVSICLGVTKNAVSMKMFRARALLRKWLAEE